MNIFTIVAIFALGYLVLEILGCGIYAHIFQRVLVQPAEENYHMNLLWSSTAKDYADFYIALDKQFRYFLIRREYMPPHVDIGLLVTQECLFWLKTDMDAYNIKHVWYEYGEAVNYASHYTKRSWVKIEIELCGICRRAIIDFNNYDIGYRTKSIEESSITECCLIMEGTPMYKCYVPQCYR